MPRPIFTTLSALSLAYCVSWSASWVISYRHRVISGDVSSGVFYIAQDGWFRRLDPARLDYNQPKHKWGGFRLWGYPPFYFVIRAPHAVPVTVLVVLPAWWLIAWLRRRRSRDRDRSYSPAAFFTLAVVFYGFVRSGIDPYGAMTIVTAVTVLTLRDALSPARRRLRAGLCPACGYDLRASSGTCPECGADPADFTAHAPWGRYEMWYWFSVSLAAAWFIQFADYLHSVVSYGYASWERVGYPARVAEYSGYAWAPTFAWPNVFADLVFCVVLIAALNALAWAARWLSRLRGRPT
jgi:hypothetical protein